MSAANQRMVLAARPVDLPAARMSRSKLVPTGRCAMTRCACASTMSRYRPGRASA